MNTMMLMILGDELYESEANGELEISNVDAMKEVLKKS
jgi:hypothetical protein